MPCVVLHGFGVDHDVINIDLAEAMELLQQGIHGSLKRRWRITQAEGHHAILERDPPGLDGRALPVFLENQDLMEHTAQIHFC